MKKILVALLLVGAALPVVARELSQVIEVEYAMGDGESRTSARQAALDELKRKAANAAGTYVQSTTTLRSDLGLEETVEMLGAAMVQVSEVEEAVRIDGSGRLVLVIRARTSIDQQALSDRIAALQNDQEKAKQVERLREQNMAMRQELLEVRRALAGQVSTEAAAALLQKQSKALNLIAENQRSVVTLLEPGSLLDQAQRSKADIEQRLTRFASAFAALIKEIKPSASVAQIAPSSLAGDKVLVEVSVDAALGVAEVMRFGESVERKYLHIPYNPRSRWQSPDYIKQPWIGFYTASDSGRRNYIDDAVKSCLAQAKAWVEVELAEQVVRIPLTHQGQGSYKTMRQIKGFSGERVTFELSNAAAAQADAVRLSTVVDDWLPRCLKG